MKKGFVVLNSILCGILALIFIVTNIAVLSMFDFFTTLTSHYGLDLSGEAAAVVQDEAIMLTKAITEEGIVLLRNERNALPLKKSKAVNLFGWSSTQHIAGGSGGSGGSSDIAVTLKQSFENAGFAVNEELYEMYVSFQSARVTETEEDRYTTAWTITEPALSDKAYYTDALLDNAEAFSDIAVLTVSRSSGEGVDIPEGYLSLTPTEKELAKYLVDHYETVIVLVNSNAVMELGYLEEIDVEAIFFMPGTGAYGAEAIGRLIRGTVNPSGRLADTMAYDHQSSPSYWFANKQGTMEYSNLPGWYYVDYVEGIYVGYKYYETAAFEGYIDYDAAVQYPFGYGLSYTTFEKTVTAARGDLTSDAIEIDVRVKNTGTEPGKEVVQIYATVPYTKGGIEKAYVDLVGFAKTDLLQPGGEQTVTVTVDPFEIASYDWNDRNGDGRTGYVLERGTYELKLMDNSHDLSAAAATLSLDHDVFITNDPKTGEPIRNLFDDAAGQSETEPVRYLSRADFAGTFPKRIDETNLTGRAASEAVKAAADKRHIAYENDPSAAKITTRRENGLRLFTLADGTFATQKQLEGGLENGETLVPNRELIDRLLQDENDPLWEDLLDQLSLSEMKEIITDAAFGTGAIESIGLMATHHTDGPQGLSSFSADAGKGVNYPVQEYIAQTWNTEIAAAQGTMFGREAQIGGIGAMYAPAVNIHRTPYCGRNFEYYSEDGFLAGSMAAEVVKNAKAQGVILYVKHFALNDQEQYRGENTTSLMTWSNEQSMREIYLKPFELAVKNGGAAGIMSSFNRIGATWSGASEALLTDLLRTEWGFIGAVISDMHMHFGFAIGGMLMDEWWMNTEQGVRAGQDMWLGIAGIGLKPNLRTGNPSTQRAMRDSIKHIIQAVVQTSVVPNRAESSWFAIALPADILVGALLVLYVVFIVRRAKRGRQRKNA